MRRATVEMQGREETNSPTSNCGLVLTAGESLEIAGKSENPAEGSSELAVLDARLDIGVRGLNETGKGLIVDGDSGFEFYVAHELAGALQQAEWIGQRGTVKEPQVDVRSEDIDVAKGRISETGNRTTVVHELADLVAAIAQRLKPVTRDRSQVACAFVQPPVDGWVVLDSAVKSEQVRFHCRHPFRIRESC
jgi:hypothetical protein